MVKPIKHPTMPHPPVSPITTYTTIPISASGVFSSSLHNLTAALSRLRPWPELVPSGAFDCPDSFAAALTRLHINFRYFIINYTIIVSVCAALSLIGSPISLILLTFILALWLLLYFFREDPLVLWGYQVSDRLVLGALVLVSVLSIWITGVLWALVLGIFIGVLICGIHAVFRNSDGLYVGGLDGASGPVIVSVSGHGYGAVSSSDGGEFST